MRLRGPRCILKWSEDPMPVKPSENEEEYFVRQQAELKRRLATEHQAKLKAERDAKTIVARTEIGSARRNTNCNLLHSYAATQAVGRTARK